MCLFRCGSDVKEEMRWTEWRSMVGEGLEERDGKMKLR